MKSPFTERFVTDIATEFSLDRKALREALDLAWEGVCDDRDVLAYRQPLKNEIPNIQRMLRLMERTKAKWEKLSPRTRDSVSEFLGGETADVFVTQRMDDIIELFREFKEHYGNTRGNPGRAHGPKRFRRGKTSVKTPRGADIDLFALEGLTSGLMEFWHQSTRQRFGHVIEEDYEHGDETDDSLYAAVAKSPAIAFVHSCARQIEPSVTLETCQTLMRKAKKIAA